MKGTQQVWERERGDKGPLTEWVNKTMPAEGVCFVDWTLEWVKTWASDLVTSEQQSSEGAEVWSVNSDLVTSEKQSSEGAI
jgi:hypothetical protein